MRIQVPFGASNPSTPIVPMVSIPGVCVVISNCGTVQVWVGDSQVALDGSLSSDGTYTPQYGHVFQPGEKISIDTVTSGFWARCAATGGQLEVTFSPKC